jgi:hypothetical protein
MITFTIKGGANVELAWRQGMSALNALQDAYDLLNQSEYFTFAIQYYGSQFDYLVIMINETYDSFISKGGITANPFYYWAFKINGNMAQQGVSNTILVDGDIVEFDFTMFESTKHKGTNLDTKHSFQTNSLSR